MKNTKTTRISTSGNGDGLPSKATKQVVDYTALRWLFVAPPGFGKTEFFSLFPDSLMLSCEEGHMFIEGFKIIIDAWDGTDEFTDDNGNLHLSFVEAVVRIITSDRFKFIIIDTLDALVKKCIDWHLNEANLKHISEAGDYGKGYALCQNDPVRIHLGKLFTSGRGIGLITHQLIETRTFAKGPKTKKETTLPNGIFRDVFPQMDLIIHGEFGGQQEGNRFKDRIIKSEGSEEILAKNRGGILPPAWISPKDPKVRAEQIERFFTNPESVEEAYQQFLSVYEGE